MKGSDEALTKFQGLTIAQKIWQGEQLEAQTQLRINADIATREAIENVSRLQQTVGFFRSLEQVISGNYAAAATYYAQYFVKTGALKDELQQEALLAKQHQELHSSKSSCSTRPQSPRKRPTNLPHRSSIWAM